MKSRVTLSLDESTVEFLNRGARTQTGGNVSAYVDRLVRHTALAESVAQHAKWYLDHPDYAELDELERDSE
jgi:hypothetical protein